MPNNFLEQVVASFLRSWCKASQVPALKVEQSAAFMRAQIKNLDFFAQAGLVVIFFIFQVCVYWRWLWGFQASSFEDTIVHSLRAWKNSRLGLLRDFVRFVESLGLFGFLSLSEEESHGI